MYKRKDNLTDLVETVSGIPESGEGQGSGDQQVRESDGNIVILGHKTSGMRTPSNNKGSLELSDRETVRTLTETVREALHKSLDDFLAKMRKNNGK